MRKCIAAAAVVLCFAVSVRPIWAQPTPEDIAAADKLFKKGKELHEAGRYAEAIPNFEAVLKIVNPVNTAHRLADCYERTGRIASAYGLYKDVERRSTDQAQQRDAREHAQALEPRLPYATLYVPPEVNAISTLSIGDGDRQITKALWGQPLPVDPGAHIFKITAEGYEPKEIKKDFAEKEKITIEIPMLDPKPAQTGSSRKTAAIVVGAVGVVGLGVGSVFGGLTFSNWAKANPEKNCVKVNGIWANCSDGTITTAERANTFAILSDIGFVVGLAGVATGVILYATAPKKNQPTSGQMIQFTPVVDRSNIGGNLLLRF